MLEYEKSVVETKALLLLQQAKSAQLVSDLAIAQADFILRNYRCADQEAIALLMLVLQARLEQGDVCLRLDPERTPLSLIIRQWQQELNQIFDPQLKDAALVFINTCKEVASRIENKLELCLKGCDAVALQEENPESKPLLLSCRRLYTGRYFKYEVQAAAFAAAAQTTRLDVSKGALAENILFPKGSKSDIDWQKVAAAMTLCSRLTVISGGPGTGKTTTVTKILLQQTALSVRPPVIGLCAPTGKAAARMAESVGHALEDQSIYRMAEHLCALNPELYQDAGQLLNSIPREAVTVHALLKVRPHSATPIFNAEHKLNLDILVVDEVSMIDLALFAKLIAAIPDQAKVILLGDKDQLCSVEAGSVMADLCSRMSPEYPDAVSEDKLDLLSKLSGFSVADLKQYGYLGQNTVMLQKSWRFGADSGIKTLADAVNHRQSAKFVLNILSSYADLKLIPLDALSISAAKARAQQLMHACIVPEDPDNQDNYREFLEYLKRHKFCLNDETARLALLLMDKFRILCSNRSGILGTININNLLAAEVRAAYPAGGNRDWYPGKIVMITHNDSALGVHNGDVGFTAYDEEHHLRVWLPGAEGKLLKISPVFIGNIHEPGFAVTIHKSQGSEYARVLTLLALDDNPVLTKELIYTAVTRAKQHLSLACSLSCLKQALPRQVARDSALAYRMATFV